MVIRPYTRRLPGIAAVTALGIARLSAGDVDFVPYYEPGSNWTSSAGARTAAEGMFAQLEATLKTNGAWNASIEVWLNDDESWAYASASAGSFHTVTHHGKSGLAGNPWAQIVQGLPDPNGEIDPATGANADIRVNWNFSLSHPETNIGLLRHELMHGLGMASSINLLPVMAVDGTITRPGAGTTTGASVHDLCIVDAAGNPMLRAAVSGLIIDEYTVDDDWDDANGSGLRIRGAKDNAGGVLELPLTSRNSSGVRLRSDPAYNGGTHTGVVDFAHIDLVSYAFAHPTWNTLAEVDRAWLRGIGYSITGGPAAPQPVISTPALLALDEDAAATRIWFTVEDGQSPAESLIVDAAPDSATPAFSATTGGQGAIRFVSIQPLTDRFGEGTLVLRVTDPEGNRGSAAFAVIVNGINDPPSIDAIPEVIVPAATASATVALTLSDIDNSAASLTLTAVSSDPDFVPPASILLEGTGSQRRLVIQPMPARTGEGEIHLTVSDGSLSASRSVRCVVAHLTPGDDHAGNAAGASTIGGPGFFQTGMLTAGDVDYFRFHAPGAGLLIAWTTGGIGTAGALFNADGTELQSGSASEGGDFRISSPVAAGLHYIEVKAERPETAGRYAVHLQFVPANSPFAVTSFARSGTDVLLGFPGKEDTNYQIEWSDDLLHWTNFRTVPGNKREVYERLPGLATVPQRYFRVYEGPIIHPVLRLASHHYPFDSDGADALGGTANFELANITFSDGGVYCNGVYRFQTPPGFTATAQLPRQNFSGLSFSLRFKPELQSASVVPVIVIDSYRAFEVAHQSGSLRVRLNNGDHVFPLNSAVVTAGAWNTIACAIEARSVRLALNGAAVSTVTLPPGVVWGLSPAGGSTQVTFTNYGNGTAFKGWIDDLRFYPLALTDAGLQAVPR